MESGAPPDDSTSRSPEGGGNKGKQRKSDIDVEEEQSKLAQERKRKARANEGDDRFSKKSKDEEGAESKKFDVSEDELGASLVRIKELVLRILTNIYREISSR
jgi:pre-mRNA-processing factor SLU7